MNQTLPSHAALIIGGTSETDDLPFVLKVGYGYQEVKCATAVPIPSDSDIERYVRQVDDLGGASEVLILVCDLGEGAEAICKSLKEKGLQVRMFRTVAGVEKMLSSEG